MHEAVTEPAFYDFHTGHRPEHRNHTNDAPGGMIIQYSSPVILLLGLTGNGIVLLFVHKKRGHSQAFDIYFAAMTIADTLTLVFALTPRWIDSILSLDLNHRLGPQTCIVITWITQTCFNASSLFLAAMTAQRARSVLFPFTSRSGEALRYACWVITFITLLSLALHLYLVCENSIDQSCYLGGVKDSFHKRAEGQRWKSWIVFVSIFALPFAVMIVSDVLLTWRVNSSTKKVGLRKDTRSACKGSVVQDKPSVKDRLWLLCTSNALTLTMMSTSLVFLALVGPTFLVQALIYTGALSEHSISHKTHNALDQLFFANSSTNFYFYLLTGRHFRQRLRKLSIVQKLAVINYWAGLSRVAKRKRLGVTDSMSPEEKRAAKLRWIETVDKLVQGEPSSDRWTPTVGLGDSSVDSSQSPVLKSVKSLGNVLSNLARSQEPSSAPTAQSCSAKTNSGSQPSFELYRRLSRSLGVLQTVPGGESSFTLLRAGLSDAFDAGQTSLGAEENVSMPQISSVNTLSVVFLPSGKPSADPIVDGDIHVSFGICEQPEEAEEDGERDAREEHDGQKAPENTLPIDD